MSAKLRSLTSSLAGLPLLRLLPDADAVALSDGSWIRILAADHRFHRSWVQEPGCERFVALLIVHLIKLRGRP